MHAAAPAETALLELQRRRVALTLACTAWRAQPPRTVCWARQARVILLAYLRLRRCRLAAQALCATDQPSPSFQPLDDRNNGGLQ
jgi:hypothetical protein